MAAWRVKMRCQRVLCWRPWNLTCLIEDFVSQVMLNSCHHHFFATSDFGTKCSKVAPEFMDNSPYWYCWAIYLRHNGGSSWYNVLISGYFKTCHRVCYILCTRHDIQYQTRFDRKHQDSRKKRVGGAFRISKNRVPYCIRRSSLLIM